MTAQAPVPPRGWDTFINAVVPLSGLVVAFATAIITYQVSRISDLSGDIKNVNSRVDQIYPLIAQSTSDIGYIKGSLESTTQKISAAAEKNDNLTKRLDSLVSSQENQLKDVRNLTQSVSGLTAAIKVQQQQLEDIRNRINFNPPIKGENLLFDSTIFAPADRSQSIKEGTIGATVIPIDWNDQKASVYFFHSLPESKVDFNKIILFSKDASVVNSLKQALTRAGFQIEK